MAESDATQCGFCTPGFVMSAYAFAADDLHGSIEHYATALAQHFLKDAHVARATVNVREHAWHPVVHEEMEKKDQEGGAPLAGLSYAWTKS